MSALTDLTYFIGQGKVDFATRVTAGAINSGFKSFGDVQLLDIDQSKQKIVEVEENQTGFGGTALYSPVAAPIGVKLQLTQWSMANIAFAAYGQNSGASIGGTVTAEAVTAYNNSTFYLKNIGVSAVAVKSGATTLVLNTDYTLDAAFGAITILPGSTIVPAGPGVPLTVDYTYAANNGRVDALMTQTPELCIKYRCLNVANPAGGSFGALRVTLNRVRLNLSKAMSMLAKKEGIIEVDGAILFDSTAPAGTSNYYTVEKA